MRKMLYRIVNWALSYGEVAMPIRDRSPFDAPRTSATTTFTVMKAENGTVLQIYDYSNDRNKLWVVIDGKSIGNMVDTVLVAEKLK